MADSFQRRELVHRIQCFYFFFFFCNVIRGYWSIPVWLEFPTRYEQLNCWAAVIYLCFLLILFTFIYLFIYLLHPLHHASTLSRAPSLRLLSKSPFSLVLFLSFPPSLPSSRHYRRYRATSCLLPPFTAPLSTAFLSPPLQSLSLSEGPEWGRQIVWSWMLILGDRHHMSHSHNHRAPFNPPPLAEHHRGTAKQNCPWCEQQ